MKRRGFTLIELLVVIAIIAILAAILFPVFARAREAARKSACLSNCKQIGTAIMMYAQDFDEILPMVASGACPSAQATGWADMVYPYVKNERVFDCPSSTWRMRMNTTVNPPRFFRDRGGTVAPTNIDCITGTTIPANVNYNYGVNAFGPPAGQANDFGGPFLTLAGGVMPNGALASVPAPADVIMVADSRGASPWSIAGGNGPWDYPSVEGQADSRRHSGNNSTTDRTNSLTCIFMDGHAKFLPMSRTVARPGNMWTVSTAD
jgi:prepilin-type N-terminal cleavage/methylation domain-containing protein